MKKSLYILFTLIVLMTSCAPEAPKFRLKGHIENMKMGTLYIYNQNDETASFDTLNVEYGDFTYDGTSEGVSEYYLVFPNAVEQVVFVEGGKLLKYEASLNDLKNYTVDGLDANKIMNEFRQRISNETDDRSIRAIATHYIKTYPDSPAAIYLLDRYYVQVDNVNLAQLSALHKAIKTVQPDNPYIQSLEGRLKQKKATKVGKKLPSLKMETDKKDTLDISKYKNKYELLYFWATWMANADLVQDNVYKFHEKYGEEHDIKVLSISLDGSKYQWQDFVRDDTLFTTHLYDGLAWESPAVKKLGVTSLPYFILADKNKKITAMGSNLSALQDGLEPTTP